jgi:hypothetical protein
MPMNSPWERVEDEHAEHRRDGGDEVRARGDPVQPAGGVAVQGDQRADVDELDHGGVHNRGERRLGQLLEEPGEDQQRDDRQCGDDQPGELRMRARAPR